MSTMTYSGVLRQLTCWCGTRFAVPDRLRDSAVDDGHTIYCPHGHKCHWGDTREKQLERELIEERRRLEATRNLLDHEERSHNATKGHLTRQKKRASAGVCPCCNRTFQQLSRHMKSKHPDYGKNGAEA